MRLITVTTLLLLLLTGCVPPVKQTTTTPADAALENQAQIYLEQGNYTAAADEYIRLAEINKNNADPFLLKAASAYLAGNDPGLAQSTIIRVREEELSEIQSTERRILHARIALLQKNADTALLMLDFQLPPDTPRSLAVDYYLSRALAFEMQGQLFDAVRSRVQLGGYLDQYEEQSNNHHLIWSLLSQPGAIDQNTELGSDESELAGWLDLAIIASTLFTNQVEMDAAIDAWQQRHEAHPAATQIVPELQLLAATTAIKPQQIALLLPFSTRYADAATAIRDGFLAAWYEAPDTEDKPVVRIYNTSGQDIMNVYNQAVTDGADFMVGPLEKEAVTTLLGADNLKVRVLALNQVNASQEQINEPAITALPSVYQFGLLPEDESNQIADRAWFNGLANALVITPDTDWGNRIFNAFSTRWEQLGGRIIAHTTIPGGSQNLAGPVKRLLNIDKSEARAKELTRILGKKIHAEPRYRQDADLIFLSAPPLVARQLIPQFRFFGVNNIAIYSSSSVYSGIHNPEADSDINGVIFADMPWLVDAALEQTSLQQTLNRNWKQSKSSYRRLYAFGIDAYRLVPGLAELALHKNSSFNGVTGTLHVSSDGVLQRTPTWVKIVNGLPKTFDEEINTK